MRKSPDHKTLKETFDDLSPEGLKELWATIVSWHTGKLTNRKMLERANELLKGYEVLFVESINKGASAFYVNRGTDLFDTLVLDVRRKTLLVMTLDEWKKQERERGNKFP